MHDTPSCHVLCDPVSSAKIRRTHTHSQLSGGTRKHSNMFTASASAVAITTPLISRHLNGSHVSLKYCPSTRNWKIGVRCFSGNSNPHTVALTGKVRYDGNNVDGDDNGGWRWQDEDVCGDVTEDDIDGKGVVVVIGNGGYGRMIVLVRLCVRLENALCRECWMEWRKSHSYDVAHTIKHQLGKLSG